MYTLSLVMLYNRNSIIFKLVEINNKKVVRSRCLEVAEFIPVRCLLRHLKDLKEMGDDGAEVAEKLIKSLMIFTVEVFWRVVVKFLVNHFFEV